MLRRGNVTQGEIRMGSFRLISRFALVAILSGCSVDTGSSLTKRTNSLLESYLGGAGVELSSISSGDKFRMPALFVIDSAGEENCLSITFARSSINDQFIQDLFSSKNGKELELSPFTEPGVEAVLTPDKVVFNIYSGVVVHIQPKMMYPGGYTMFKVQAPMGEVTTVVGRVMHDVPGKPLPKSLVKFLYVRDGGALMAPASIEEIAKAKDLAARRGLRFQPTSLGKSVDPVSIACKAR